MKVWYMFQLGVLTIGVLGLLWAPLLTPEVHALNQSSYFGQGNAMAMAAIAEQEIRDQDKESAKTLTVALNDEKENPTDRETKETEEK
ncbi:MAG: hypothetical protein GTN68_17965 [Candidatus Aminicenantes bacterium]|nr:hypothetical protein [Candidatus Aminicenantes bacterium]